MVNNFTYAMTGGQVAPTTPLKVHTPTTPYGNYEHPLDVVELVKAAGACFAARWTTYHVTQLTSTIKTALTKQGFSFIEIIAQCPTIYGRRSGLETAIDMIRHFEKTSVLIDEAKGIDPTQLKDKTVVGIFVDVDKPGFISLYKDAVESSLNIYRKKTLP